MSYLKTISPAESQGEIREMYQRQEDHWGYVPNYAKAFSLRPKVLERWAKLLSEIRRPMDDRLFELATFAAAHELKNTPCALVHGKALGKFIGDEAVVAIGAGQENEALDEAEAAVVDFARSVARDATSVSETQVQRLRDAGYSDESIFDIANAAAGRAYFTKLLDGIGVAPDGALEKLEASFREPLTVGREIPDAPDERLGVPR